MRCIKLIQFFLSLQIFLMIRLFVFANLHSEQLVSLLPSYWDRKIGASFLNDYMSKGWFPGT